MLKDTIFYHPTCRDLHSIETLLLRLLSDVYGISTDPTQFFTLLALFNVNAPFNTVDQEILHNWLHVSFGLSGNFLLSQWAFLYSFSVVHGPTRFGWVPVTYGLPQGSALGPILYVIYTSGLASLLTNHAALGQLYADTNRLLKISVLQ